MTELYIFWGELYHFMSDLQINGIASYNRKFKFLCTFLSCCMLVQVFLRTDHWEGLLETVCWKCPPQCTAASWECPLVPEHPSGETGHPGVWLWKWCKSLKFSEALDLLELIHIHTHTCLAQNKHC